MFGLGKHKTFFIFIIGIIFCKEICTRMVFALFSSKPADTFAVVNNAAAEFKKHGLDVLQVAWEDTARSKNSCWGPNISDMTLAQKGTNAADIGALAPIIRTPNFADVSTDIDMNKIKVAVPSAAAPISLREYLGNISHHEPLLFGRGSSLLKSDETMLLAQSQTCVLPATGGKVDFAPVLYNYQSHDGDPAVAVFVIAAGGVTVHVPGTKRKPLFFREVGGALRWFGVEKMRANEVTTSTMLTAQEKNENMLIVLQVPLVQKPKTLTAGDVYLDDWGTFGYEDESSHELFMFGASSFTKKSKPRSIQTRGDRGTDMGRVSAGSHTGTSQSRDKARVLVRDERFPIRATVQFYRIAHGPVTPADVEDIALHLKSIGKNWSSLVTPPPARPTEPQLPPQTFATPMELESYGITKEKWAGASMLCE